MKRLLTITIFARAHKTFGGAFGERSSRYSAGGPNRNLSDILVLLPKPPLLAPVGLGRVPRLARLMALVIHFDSLIRRGAVRDYADLARLGHVTRARVTQVTNILNLMPDIQEEILFLPRMELGQAPVSERQIRHVIAASSWEKRRRLW